MSKRKATKMALISCLFAFVAIMVCVIVFADSGSDEKSILSEKYEQVLSKFGDVIDNFNTEYGVSYKLVSPEECSQFSGSDEDELLKEYEKVLGMETDEFENYLCKAYILDKSFPEETNELPVEAEPYYPGTTDGSSVSNGQSVLETIS